MHEVLLTWVMILETRGHDPLSKEGNKQQRGFLPERGNPWILLGDARTHMPTQPFESIDNGKTIKLV